MKVLMSRMADVENEAYVFHRTCSILHGTLWTAPEFRYLYQVSYSVIHSTLCQAEEQPNPESQWLHRSDSVGLS